MMAIASSISASLTVSGGANRSDVGVTALVTKPAIEQFGVHGLGIATVGQLSGEQQPAATNTGDAGQLPQSSAEVLALAWRPDPVHRSDASRR